MSLSDLTESTKFAIFVPVWIGIGVVTWIMFSARTSYETKRRWAPRLIVLAGLLFIGFFYWAMGPTGNILFPAAIALITIINLRTVQFCPGCGALQRRPGLFSRPRHCYKCGHDLQKPGTGR